jgi:hypothetical protein
MLILRWLCPFRKTAMHATPGKWIIRISSEEKIVVATRASEMYKSETGYKKTKQPISTNKVKRDG